MMVNPFYKVLFVATIIDYADGPLIFTARDSVGTRFLCTYLQTTSEGSEYLCVPASKGRLNSFLKGTRDLRSMYVGSESQEFYLLVTNRDDPEPLAAKPIQIGQIQEELLPDDGYFIDQGEYTEEIARQRTMVEASLDLPEARHETVISSYSLAELLVDVQDAVKYGYKKRISRLPFESRRMISAPDFYTLQAYAFSTSSFTVHLRSAVAGRNLLGNDDLDDAVNLVAKFVSLAGDPVKAIELLKENKGHFVSAIKRIISLPITHKCSFGFGWRAANSKTMERFIISYEDAVKLQAAIAEEAEIEKQLIEYVGIFTDLETTNIQNQTWTIMLESGEYVNGRVDEMAGISLSGCSVRSGKYRVWCEDRLIEDATGKERHELVLYKFNEISIHGRSLDDILDPEE